MEFDSVKHLQLFLPRQLTAVYACVGANSFARYLENGRGTRTTPITPFIRLSGLITDRKHQDPGSISRISRGLYGPETSWKILVKNAIEGF